MLIHVADGGYTWEDTGDDDFMLTAGADSTYHPVDIHRRDNIHSQFAALLKVGDDNATRKKIISFANKNGRLFHMPIKWYGKNDRKDYYKRYYETYSNWKDALYRINFTLLTLQLVNSIISNRSVKPMMDYFNRWDDVDNGFCFLEFKLGSRGTMLPIPSPFPLNTADYNKYAQLLILSLARTINDNLTDWLLPPRLNIVYKRFPSEIDNVHFNVEYEGSLLGIIWLKMAEAFVNNNVPNGHCKCGCGLPLLGKKGQQFYNNNHRVRYWQATHPKKS